MRYRRMLVVAASIWIAALLVGHAEPQTRPAREAAYTEMFARSGDEYLAARNALLSIDRNQAMAFLQSKHEAVTEAIPRLCVEAVSARLKDPIRLDNALADAFAAASRDRSKWYRRPLPSPTPPEPNAGGRVLIYRLGDDAAPLATELIYKGLTNHWESWKRQVLVCALSNLGESATRIGPIRSKITRITSIRDSRAAWALLWVAEHAADDKCCPLASRNLGRFASDELLAAVASARGRVASEERKEQLDGAVKAIQGVLRRRADPDAYGGPRVTTRLPFKFALDATRILSSAERSQLDRLVAIGEDPKETLSRRVHALGLLGENVAHRDCVEPLCRILNDPSQPEELRYAAVIALSQIPDKSVVPILIGVLEGDSTAGLRSQARLQLSRVSGGHSFGGFGRCADKERTAAAAKWWKQWWEEHQADFVPDRIRTIMQQY